MLPAHIDIGSNSVRLAPQCSCLPTGNDDHVLLYMNHNLYNACFLKAFKDDILNKIFIQQKELHHHDHRHLNHVVRLF